MYRYLEPEVSGGLGKKTQLDSSTHPPIVTKLHYVFDGWLGDDILETFPCFIITESLKNKIESEGLTGITFDSVLISKSETFVALYPNRQLPLFFWAKIIGEFKEADFFIGNDNRLIVSDSAYNILKAFNIENGLFEDFLG